MEYHVPVAGLKSEMSARESPSKSKFVRPPGTGNGVGVGKGVGVGVGKGVGVGVGKGVGVGVGVPPVVSVKHDPLAETYVPISLRE